MQKALTLLTQAVSIAQLEGYIRRFVDEGPMATLLSRLREQQRKQGPTPYLDSLLVTFSPDGSPSDPGNLHPGSTSQPAKSTEHVPQQPLLDPLSKRELDVLRLLARGASNQEIAEVLVIALNTVHHHVSNILSKLEVSNRTQAMT